MRLSHSAAVATLVALFGAMFIAMGSASAQAVSACSANPDITLGIGESCTIAIANTGSAESEDSDIATALPASVSDNDGGTITIAGLAVGQTEVTIVDFGADDTDNTPEVTGANADVSTKYVVNVAGFAITKVAIKGDNDNVVSAGPQIKVTATVRSAVEASEVRLTVPTTGLSIETNAGSGATSQSHTLDTGDGGTDTFEFTVNTAGAPAGQYVLTFTADQDGEFSTTPSAPEAGTAATAEENKQDSEPLTIVIGDPGTGLSSATLSLGNKMDDLPYTADDETDPETGTAAANGGSINLVIEVFDSLGGKANVAAVNQITVIAPGGTISSSHPTGVDGTPPPTAGGNNSATLDETDDATGDPPAGTVGQRTGVTVSKTDKKPGQVTVYALVIGPGGAARTEDLVLSFSGSSTSMTVSDATETLLSANPAGEDPDVIKLMVATEDASGIATTPPTSGVSITIAGPDGKRVDRDKIMPSDPMAEGGKHYIKLTGHGTLLAPLAAGTYTVKVKSGSLEDSAEFVVAGSAASVSLEADKDSVSEVGEQLKVTATVLDEDGHPVADGTTVTFKSSDVVGDGDTVLVLTEDSANTKSGMATATLVAVGPGRSVVTGKAGTITGVKVITSTAGAPEPDAMPEEEASVGCLSNLAGFATWACGVESSASEIFGLVSGRGATALHLWNGSAWVRYSVVDGTMVPGSSDFMVAENDILYISN